MRSGVDYLFHIELHIDYRVSLGVKRYTENIYYYNIHLQYYTKTLAVTETRNVLSMLSQ